MTQLNILQEIKDSSDLLSMPQAITELLNRMDDSDFSSDQLADIILKDPSLTGRILKLANSSFYHRYSDITTVHQAVQLLGVTTVKCLALSSSVFNPERLERASGIDSKEYFSGVLTVAAACQKIAEKIDYKAVEEAFIVGLLHDIGTMLFLHRYPGEYRRVMERDVSARALIEAEHEVFGTDHSEVGYHLAIRWRLPEDICRAIRDHHLTAREADPTLTNILRLAVNLSTESTTNYAGDIETRIAVINHTARCLGLTKEEVDGISISLLGWTVSVAEYLGIDIGSIEDMLSRANREIWRTYLMVENLFRERQELSQKLLQEERAKGAVESKNIAIATLSHYLNNAAMAVYGRSQLMRMQLKKGQNEKIVDKLPDTLDVMDRSIKKIVAVLAEIKAISPIDEVEFLSTSQAMNIDDRIANRMDEMEKESGLVLPDDAEIAAS